MDGSLEVRAAASGKVKELFELASSIGHTIEQADPIDGLIVHHSFCRVALQVHDSIMMASLVIGALPEDESGSPIKTLLRLSTEVWLTYGCAFSTTDDGRILLSVSLGEIDSISEMDLRTGFDTIVHLAPTIGLNFDHELSNAEQAELSKLDSGNWISV